MDPQQYAAFMLGAATMMPALYNHNPMPHMGYPPVNQPLNQPPNDFLTQYMNTYIGQPSQGEPREGDPRINPAKQKRTRT